MSVREKNNERSTHVVRLGCLPVEAGQVQEQIDQSGHEHQSCHHTLPANPKHKRGGGRGKKRTGRGKARSQGRNSSFKNIGGRNVRKVCEKKNPVSPELTYEYPLSMQQGKGKKMRRKQFTSQYTIERAGW